MKAISIKEPWLTEIVEGRKSIETRTRRTSHRGDLLLVGSKKPAGKYAGKAACVVNLVDCRPMVAEDEELAKCKLYWAYSWVLEDVRPVVPFDVRGQLGLYEVPHECIRYCRGSHYRVWTFNSFWPRVNNYYPVDDPFEGMDKLKDLMIDAVLDKDKGFTVSGLEFSDDKEAEDWEEYHDESGQDIHEMMRELDDDHNYSEQF